LKRIYGLGTFGLIHPVSDHFCEACSRLRLTTDGNIKPCLYWSDEFNVLKQIGDDQAIADLLLRALDINPLNLEMAKALSNEAQRSAGNTTKPTRGPLFQVSSLRGVAFFAS
jgi:molybdenum cofactor biosynthesis enzyme MoaA